MVQVRTLVDPGAGPTFTGPDLLRELNRICTELKAHAAEMNHVLALPLTLVGFAMLPIVAFGVVTGVTGYYKPYDKEWVPYVYVSVAPIVLFILLYYLSRYLCVLFNIVQFKVLSRRVQGRLFFTV